MEDPHLEGATEQQDPSQERSPRSPGGDIFLLTDPMELALLSDKGTEAKRLSGTMSSSVKVLRPKTTRNTPAFEQVGFIAHCTEEAHTP